MNDVTLDAMDRPMLQDNDSSGKRPSWMNRRFAGLTYPTLALATGFLFALLWGAWATSELFALQERRIVTVKLAELVGDFVQAEAKSGSDAATSKARTAAYLAAIDRSVAVLAEDGTTVLVAEAVLSTETTADVTGEVRALIVADMKAEAE